MAQVHSAQGQDRQGPDRRRRAPVQEEQDRLDQGQRPAGRQRTSRGHRGPEPDAHRDARKSSSPPARSRAACRASRSIAKRIITSDEAIGLREVPKSIAIMGSGAVGVEFASIFRRFGSDVTIIELLPRLVPVEDEAVSAELERSFKKQGIKVMTGTQGHVREGRRRRRRPRRADARRQDDEAEGRVPARRDRTRAGHLGARRRGGRAGDGARLHQGRTNGSRRTCRGISAIGDVITFEQPGHPQLAHLSSAEGIALAERIAGQEFRPINYDQVPGCTYCDPEIGSVGLTEKEAQARGYDVKTGTFKFGILGPRADCRRDRRLRQDRLRQEIRRDPRRAHDRPARDGAGRRSDARAAPRVHGRRADPHDSRAPDDVGGGR